MGKKDKKKKKGGKKEKSASKGNTEFVQTKYAGSINLAKLQHVILKKKDKKGKKIECLLLPIDKNYIQRGDDGQLYMNVSVITKTPQDDYGQNGFIGQNVPSAIWKEMSEKQKEKSKKLPILGNIKNFDDSKDTGATWGQAGDPIDEEDDLPF